MVPDAAAGLSGILVAVGAQRDDGGRDAADELDRQGLPMLEDQVSLAVRSGETSASRASGSGGTG